MKTEPNPQPLFGFPMGPWHDHFAWWPVRTYDGRLVWLKWVRRRGIQKLQHLDGGDDQWFQYHCEGRS
jgi:hypothetical protein